MQWRSRRTKRRTLGQRLRAYLQPWRRRLAGVVSVAVLLLMPLGAFALTTAELNYVVNLQLHDLFFFHKADEQQLVQSEMARHKQFFATHHSKAARKLFQQGIVLEQQRFNQHSAAQDQLVFQTIAFEQSTHTISPYTLTFFTP